ncbi:3-phosphoshikimate 1-carboxyvinyltransferase [Caldithrix abyssi]|uniref:3-phosphoshikimate 1-carboxyvinyltransferase n=2 Tax=Caldithrix abyssi DSM 13497 TaxID=880073 RepID=A0A1J1CC90_CALAY|nr:3-phosphoshikimate 1-carboxyvinyltransferase [Caldithrix abyssi]APF19520.1 3-phosphoshikimate 1-carboxyvinyltransferase [Caldithrix abyssi DSM 13497]
MPKLKGTVLLPGDKSISHRAALFSAIREGTSYFENFNFNRDCLATLACLRAVGVEIETKEDTSVRINGKDPGRWQKPDHPLNAENSGTTARLLSALLANLPFPTTLIGDASLSRRPMKRIIEPLTQMGADIRSNNGYLPLEFFPVSGLKGIDYELPVASAQVKSAVLMAGLFAEGATRVIETIPSRDHTERLLNLPVEIDARGRKIIRSRRGLPIPDISMKIPGDFSSAAFFITGALLLPGSELMIKNVSLNPTRTGFLEVLKQMGAQLEINLTQQEPEPAGEIVIRPQKLHNIEIPEELIPNIIDEIPILSILAARSEGTLVLRHASELRFKESDRIKAIVQNLRQIGVEVEEFEDGFQVCGPQSFKGGKITTFGDHRIAMSFAIADLLSDEPIEPDDPDCAAVSFPDFYHILKSVVQA